MDFSIKKDSWTYKYLKFIGNGNLTYSQINICQLFWGTIGHSIKWLTYIVVALAAIVLAIGLIVVQVGVVPYELMSQLTGHHQYYWYVPAIAVTMFGSYVALYILDEYELTLNQIRVIFYSSLISLMMYISMLWFGSIAVNEFFDAGGYGESDKSFADRLVPIWSMGVIFYITPMMYTTSISWRQAMKLKFEAKGGLAQVEAKQPGIVRMKYKAFKSKTCFYINFK